MDIKNTPVAKVFDVGIYKFAIQLVTGILLLSAAYWLLVSRVDKNEIDIGLNLVYGEETRNIATAHIEGTKGEPLSELALTNKVGNLEKDVGELVEDTDKNTEGRILHDKNMAVQELQNEVILEKLDKILKQNGHNP